MKDVGLSGVDAGEKVLESTVQGRTHRQSGTLIQDKRRHILECTRNKAQVTHRCKKKKKPMEKTSKGLYGKPALLQSQQRGLNLINSVNHLKPGQVGNNRSTDAYSFSFVKNYTSGRVGQLQV